MISDFVVRHATGMPATTPTTPPTVPPHRPLSPGHHNDPGTLPPQIDDPDPADIPEAMDPEQPHPRLRHRSAGPTDTNLP